MDILEIGTPLKFKQTLFCPKCVEGTKTVLRAMEPFEVTEEIWQCAKCNEQSTFSEWLRSSGLKEVECE